jgi:hypothetical protein
MTREELIVCRNILIVPLVVAALWTLSVLLCRQWVKNDLRRRMCQPISVRWRWLASTKITCHFNVVYSDWNGEVHHARCWTYWHWPRVTWANMGSK